MTDDPREIAKDEASKAGCALVIAFFVLFALITLLDHDINKRLRTLEQRLQAIEQQKGKQ